MHKHVRVLSGICLLLFFLSACATKLQEAPTQEILVEDALPETTTIAAEWASPSGDTGEVDDGWLANFNDPQLVILVNEALNTQNPRMRLMSSFVSLELSTENSEPEAMPRTTAGRALNSSNQRLK